METIQYQRRINSNGYISIYINEWILEHKFIVEEFIGRKLTKEETVHHIDFCRTNNDIDNLVILPNQKDHAHFHRQIKQFGMTRPRLKQIEELKFKMEKERCVFKN